MVNNELWNIHPCMEEQVNLLCVALNKTPFRLFETLRLPMRQIEIWTEGHSKARAWQSPHQYGLAVDFAGLVDGSWTWSLDLPWNKLKEEAELLGLKVPIEWDLGHVEHPNWKEIYKEIKSW